jgi:RNA 2',3'-cyclic 3'-phosphodiesterase
MADTPTDAARLFIALWPGDAMRDRLHAWSAPCLATAGTRPVATPQLHLTLHFLGNVARTKLPALRAALRLPMQAFELRFSTCERWPGGLLVTRPDVVPQALSALHARLGDGLRGLGLPTELRAFRPHVTLARRHTGALPPPAEPPLRWRVRQFVLVESGRSAGAGYTLLDANAAGAAPPRTRPP